MKDSHAKPTVKQHLATIRMLFDWLVVGQVVDANPAGHAVRGPKHVVTKGLTPRNQPDETKRLLASIPLKFGRKPKDGEPDMSPGSSKPATYGRFKTSHDSWWFRTHLLTLTGSAACSKSQVPAGFLFPAETVSVGSAS